MTASIPTPTWLSTLHVRDELERHVSIMHLSPLFHRYLGLMAQLEAAHRHQSNKAALQAWARTDIQVGSHCLPMTILGKKTKASFSDGVFTVRRIVNSCFYYLSFEPDNQSESPDITNDTKFSDATSCCWCTSRHSRDRRLQ